MKKLVLTDGRYEFDNKTGNVSVSEDELRKAGYVKLADDEQIVKKVELSEEEAEFMQETERLAFYDPQNIDFEFKANDYAEENAKKLEDAPGIYGRLIQAHFYGYIVRETKYYIEFPEWVFPLQFRTVRHFLNVFTDSDKLDKWEANSKEQTRHSKTQFTQKEIDELQKCKQAKGLDLNALKVKVPDEELAD